MTDILLVLLAGMLCIISYQIKQLKEFLMATFIDLVNSLDASVAGLTDVATSAEQLLTNLSAAIAALTAQLATQGVSDAVIAQVTALKTKIDTDKADLAAAVAANTQPVVTPPPPPVGQG